MTSDNSTLHTLIWPPSFSPTIELERSIIPAHVPQTTFPSHLIRKKLRQMICIAVYNELKHLSIFLWYQINSYLIHCCIDSWNPLSSRKIFKVVDSPPKVQTYSLQLWLNQNLFLSWSQMNVRLVSECNFDNWIGKG